MIKPPISELLKKVDNRYTLVIATAKRARMLNNGAQPLVEIKSDKDVTIAIEEIKEGKVKYRYTRKGEASKPEENKTVEFAENAESHETINENNNELEYISNEAEQEETKTDNEPEGADILIREIKQIQEEK
ncbi:MAG: DNA-directed RNA polymerase subunit omega [Clostridiaceae bacterium]|jgi:DNA-directed RNA polymerase subunit omega|nr:DNA-directed RNA polymerase subunit omega [Clostridiaceae bacterium]